MGERFIHVTTPERLWTHMRVGGGGGGRSSGGGGSERASERASGLLSVVLMRGLMLSGSEQPLLRMLHDRYTQSLHLGHPELRRKGQQQQ